MTKTMIKLVAPVTIGIFLTLLVIAGIIMYQRNIGGAEALALFILAAASFSVLLISVREVVRQEIALEIIFKED